MTVDPMEIIKRCERELSYMGPLLHNDPLATITAAVIQASAIRELTAAVNRVADIAAADADRFTAYAAGGGSK